MHCLELCSLIVRETAVMSARGTVARPSTGADGLLGLIV